MDAPTIVLTGTPAWRDLLARVLDTAGYRLQQYATTESYIPRLADDHAALIVVDGESPGWNAWVTSPRVNAATRRIPIVIVTGDASRAQAGLAAGADFAVAPRELADALPALIAAHGRFSDEAYRAEMAAQCSQPLPAEARAAIEKFNRGEYYRQHDLLEALWMEESGPVRDLYRAILQVGIACYQVTQGNPRGALKVILRSIQWINILPDVCQGVDVAALRADAHRLRAALEAWPEGNEMAEFDRSMLPTVKLVDEEI